MKQITDKTRKKEATLSLEDKARIAKGNHIWINALSLVRPSEKMLQELGQMVVDKVLESEVADDFSGSFPVTWIEINAS